MLSFLIKANMIYLLVRLVYTLQSIASLMMILHFALNDLRKSRGSGHYQEGMNMSKLIEMLNPLLLYCFTRCIHGGLGELSLIFLIFLCGNLVITSELRLLLQG